MQCDDYPCRVSETPSDENNHDNDANADIKVDLDCSEDFFDDNGSSYDGGYEGDNEDIVSVNDDALTLPLT